VRVPPQGEKAIFEVIDGAGTGVPRGGTGKVPRGEFLVPL